MLRQDRRPVGTSGRRGISLILNQSLMKSGSFRCSLVIGDESASLKISLKSDASSVKFYRRRRKH